jgi:hypothetical protein
MLKASSVSQPSSANFLTIGSKGFETFKVYSACASIFFVSNPDKSILSSGSGTFSS